MASIQLHLNGSLEAVRQELSRKKPHQSKDFQVRAAVVSQLVTRPDFSQLRAEGFLPQFDRLSEASDLATMLLQQWLEANQSRKPKDMILPRKVERVGGVTLSNDKRIMVAQAFLGDYNIEKDEVWSWTGVPVSAHSFMRARGISGIDPQMLEPLLGTSNGPVYWARYRVQNLKPGRFGNITGTAAKIAERTMIENTNIVLAEHLFPRQLIYTTPDGIRYYDGTSYDLAETKSPPTE
jgi:hypothetical protein